MFCDPNGSENGPFPHQNHPKPRFLEGFMRFHIGRQVDEFMRFEDAYSLEGVESELASLYKHFMKFKDLLSHDSS